MKNENLKDYMNNIKVINKEVSEYSNEDKGIKYILPTAQLIVKIDYLELKVDAVRVIPKNEITKNEKDKFTLVESKIKAYAMWNVTNGLGIKETCTSKEEALKLYDDINKGLVGFYE